MARYDGIADWYDTEFLGDLHDHGRAAALRLGPGPGRLLDLGCGTGAHTVAFGGHGWDVTGVDASEDMLRRARARGLDGVQADASMLPFEDASFDAAVSTWTHTDIDDFAAAVREVARVLRPEGPFVYVGGHPCFVGPHALFRFARGVPELHRATARPGGTTMPSPASSIPTVYERASAPRTSRSASSSPPSPRPAYESSISRRPERTITPTSSRSWPADERRRRPWSDLLEGEEVSYVGQEPARPPRFAPIPEGLHPKVTDALAARGIEQLFTHQADAWDAAQRGEHLVVATGTASGKTLAFNLPVLDALARQPKTRALYLYPTKALAQDQIRSLTELKPPAIKPAIYDGDTESSRRWQIRKWSNLILTNPDMLHVGVLPHHDRWGDVLHNLRYVVVDEAHVYRGVFGSHVGNVLRRLRRLARIYGADPQFLLASATIANPGELAHRLLGVEATTIEQDGAPKAERTILLWNPPLTDEELGLRASALGEASRLMASLVERGVRTLCFAKSRKSAELVHRFTAQRLGDASRLSPIAPAIRPLSGVRSSAGWSMGICSGSARRTRSSSGSTSASSTPSSASASREPSRASDSSGAGPGAGATGSPR